MLESTAAPITYPGLPMARYGLIDSVYGGGNKYRIIWAPSRLVVLTGQEKTMTIPMYHGPYALEPVGEVWILEGWLSPWQLYTGTKEQWEADPMMLNTGPYPHRGDYKLRCLLPGNPSDYNMDFLIQCIEEGPKRSRSEKDQAIQEKMDASVRERKRKMKDIIQDRMRPFGGEYVGGAARGNTKTAPILKSRQELGLPEHGTNAVRLKNPVTYEIPQEAE